MRPGEVTQIRVNPKDCMGVVDVIDAAGVFEPGMSFSQAVSLTLSALLETARKNGLIPNRDGFEYSEMMGRFSGNRHSKKLAITKSTDFLNRKISMPTMESVSLAPQPGQERRKKRYFYLCEKKNADELNFGVEDQAELDSLFNELDGEGLL